MQVNQDFKNNTDLIVNILLKENIYKQEQRAYNSVLNNLKAVKSKVKNNNIKRENKKRLNNLFIKRKIITDEIDGIDTGLYKHLLNV